ncbi:MAG TPA: hypothetical protein VJJ20_03620 [Candidatus Paceibacterota bacterium]
MAAAATTTPTDSPPGAPGYHIDLPIPRDNMITTRDRMRRWMWLMGTATTAFFGPIIILWMLCWLLFNTPTLGAWLGLIAAAYPTMLALRRGLVFNRLWQGFVTQDVFEGKAVEYGPGVHPALFWEERDEDGNMPLKPIDTTFDIQVSTLTSRVTLLVFFQWMPDIRNLRTFQGVKNEEEINAAFPPFLESFLSENLANETAEVIREKIEKVNLALAVEFMGKEDPVTHQSPTKLEDNYGIRVVVIRVKGFKVSEEVQRSMDARDEALRLHGIVASFQGIDEKELAEQLRNKTLSPDDYNKLLEKAMALSGNASYNIQKLDIPGLVARYKQ